MFRVGDVVEYRCLAGETEQGVIVETDGCRYRVIYSPWGDDFWATADRLTRVTRNPA